VASFEGNPLPAMDAADAEALWRALLTGTAPPTAQLQPCTEMR
jgi:hypothetical protein